MSEQEKGVEVKEAYVIQEDITPQIRYLLSEGSGEAPPLPKTAAIPYLEWLKKFSREHIFGQEDEEVKKSLHIPDKVVRAWGLREGDKIRFTLSEGFDEIVDVNGVKTPSSLRNRPNVLDFDLNISSYPRRLFAVDKHGNPTLRAYGIISPIGKGQRLIIASPPESGKSSLIRLLLEFFLKETLDDENLFVMSLLVGERAEDAEKLKEIEATVEHDVSRVELYHSPYGEPEEANVYMTEAFINRARRLCEGSDKSGYDVVALIDCASRVLLAHSYSSKIEKPKGAGMIASGVSTASLAAVRKLHSVAGDFGNRSLTLISTMLTDEKKSRRKSSETALFDDSGPSTATAIWGLVRLPNTVPHPWIDVSLTHTRLFEQLFTEQPGRKTEHDAVLHEMWNISTEGGGSRPAKANEALRRLMSNAEKNLKYENTSFAKNDHKVS